MEQHLGIHCERCYACRVRGQDGGGWSGDKEWHGHIKFFCTMTKDGRTLPSQFKADITHMGKRGHSSLKIVALLLPKVDDEQKEIAVTGVTDEGVQVSYVFQLHRDETPCLVSFTRDALGERTPNSELMKSNKHFPIIDPCDVEQPASAKDADDSVALGVSGYASDEKQGKLEQEAAIVDYTPDDQDRMLIAMWDEMIDTFPLYPSPVARTLAVSCIRHGLKEPGKPVPYKHMAQLAGGPIVQKVLSSILSCSGLWRFAKLDDRTLAFTAPEEGNDVYDWARLREQFLAPVAEMKIEVHQLPESSVTNIPADPKLGDGLREALELTKRLDATCPIGHHPAHPKEPHLK